MSDPVEEREAGWVYAHDRGAAKVMVSARGYLIAGCQAVHEADRLCVVHCYAQHPTGGPPVVHLPKYAVDLVRQRLHIAELVVTRTSEPMRLPWLYWSGEGWLGGASELVRDGPIAVAWPEGEAHNDST